jgi:hypothetical protein
MSYSIWSMLSVAFPISLFALIIMMAAMVSKERTIHVNSGETYIWPLANMMLSGDLSILSSSNDFALYYYLVRPSLTLKDPVTLHGKFWLDPGEHVMYSRYMATDSILTVKFSSLEGVNFFLFKGNEPYHNFEKGHQADYLIMKSSTNTIEEKLKVIMKSSDTYYFVFDNAYDDFDSYVDFEMTLRSVDYFSDVKDPYEEIFPIDCAECLSTATPRDTKKIFVLPMAFSSTGYLALRSTFEEELVNTTATWKADRMWSPTKHQNAHVAPVVTVTLKGDQGGLQAYWFFLFAAVVCVYLLILFSCQRSAAQSKSLSNSIDAAQSSKMDRCLQMTFLLEESARKMLLSKGVNSYQALEGSIHDDVTLPEYPKQHWDGTNMIRTDRPAVTTFIPIRPSSLGPTPFPPRIFPGIKISNFLSKDRNDHVNLIGDSDESDGVPGIKYTNVSDNEDTNSSDDEKSHSSEDDKTNSSQYENINSSPDGSCSSNSEKISRTSRTMSAMALGREIDRRDRERESVNKSSASTSDPVHIANITPRKRSFTMPRESPVGAGVYLAGTGAGERPDILTDDADAAHAYALAQGQGPEGHSVAYLKDYYNKFASKSLKKNIKPHNRTPVKRLSKRHTASDSDDAIRDWRGQTLESASKDAYADDALEAYSVTSNERRKMSAYLEDNTRRPRSRLANTSSSFVGDTPLVQTYLPTAPESIDTCTTGLKSPDSALSSTPYKDDGSAQSSTPFGDDDTRSAYYTFDSGNTITRLSGNETSNIDSIGSAVSAHDSAEVGAGAGISKSLSKRLFEIA